MDLVYLITPLPLTPTLTLTTLATPLLVLSTVSIASTSIPSLPTTLHSSTTLLVIRVPHLMTLVCSTAPTYLSRWSVPLVRTPSKLRSDSRLATAWSPIPSLKALLLLSALSSLAPTATIVAFPSRTSCDIGSHISRDLRVPFFMLY